MLEPQVLEEGSGERSSKGYYSLVGENPPPVHQPVLEPESAAVGHVALSRHRAVAEEVRGGRGQEGRRRRRKRSDYHHSLCERK